MGNIINVNFGPRIIIPDDIEEPITPEKLLHEIKGRLSQMPPESTTMEVEQLLAICDELAVRVNSLRFTLENFGIEVDEWDEWITFGTEYAG